MNAKRIIQTFIIIVSLAATQLYAQAETEVPPIPEQEEPEILNQGPIHEAFAQPVTLAIETGVVATEQPPEDVIENPAAEKPESEDYVWIPGYWSWDSERSDFVWISGCWRIAPSEMTWIPGYWDELDDGWQWVAGFWIPTAQAEQIQYLPEPPEITETNPPETETNIVETEKIWVPPCYYWRQNRYVLRSGYWLTPRDNWVWVPSHYNWTPHGYVFVSGYWDYVLDTRGVLYAPVYFPRRYRTSRCTYSLDVVVNIGNLETCMFTYPRYRHYYFGDYYSDVYISIGIFPWFEYRKHRSWCDPIYEYKRCHYRKTRPLWSRHIRHEYDMRRKYAIRRPPRTYREVRSRLAHSSKKTHRDFRYVEPVRSYSKRNNVHMKFSHMDQKGRMKIASHTDKINKFRQYRREKESHGRSRISMQQNRLSRPSDKIDYKRRSGSIHTATQPRNGTNRQSSIRTATKGNARPGISTRQPGNQTKTRPDTRRSGRPSIQNDTRTARPGRSRPDNNKIRTATPNTRRPDRSNGNRSATPAKTRPESPKSWRNKSDTPSRGRPSNKRASLDNSNTINQGPPNTQDRTESKVAIKDPKTASKNTTPTKPDNTSIERITQKVHQNEIKTVTQQPVVRDNITTATANKKVQPQKQITSQTVRPEIRKKDTSYISERISSLDAANKTKVQQIQNKVQQNKIRKSNITSGRPSIQNKSQASKARQVVPNNTKPAKPAKSKPASQPKIKKNNRPSSGRVNTAKRSSTARRNTNTSAARGNSSRSSSVKKSAPKPKKQPKAKQPKVSKPKDKKKNEKKSAGRGRR